MKNVASPIIETLTDLAELVCIHCSTKDRCIVVSTSVKKAKLYIPYYI